MNSKREGDQYSEAEAQRRFEAAVKAALNTPPKPRKTMARSEQKYPSERHARCVASFCIYPDDLRNHEGSLPCLLGLLFGGFTAFVTLGGSARDGDRKRKVRHDVI